MFLSCNVVRHKVSPDAMPSDSYSFIGHCQGDLKMRCSYDYLIKKPLFALAMLAFLRGING